MGAESATLAHAPAKQSAKQAIRPAAACRPSTPLREPAAPPGVVAPTSFASIAPFAPRERRPAIPFNYPDLRLPLQRRLAIGEVNDPLEREADSVAQRILSMPGSNPQAIGSGAPAILRKCACEASGHSCETCEEKKKHSVQRKAAGVVPTTEAPPIVHEVLRSPGQPLDSATRAFMEPRFGFDFSGVRIHTDDNASESTKAVNARAFTVGRNIVFGRNQYAPVTHSGRELLAHELAHTLQQAQRAENPVVARACLSAAECAVPVQGAQGTFVAQTEALPANVAKAKRRQNLCGSTPVNPGCTSDGHGRAALELQKFMAAQLPARVSAIKGVYVDMDIPAQYGGYTNLCGTFTPPIPAGADEMCTFVPAQLEREAGLYNSGVARIGPLDRRAWSQVATRTLTHETEHALFAHSPAETDIKTNRCDFQFISSSLTELAAIISEFRPVYLKSLALTQPARDAELRGWFRFWVHARGESLAGNVKDIRCRCDCGNADEYIRNTFQFASKDWNDYQRWLYNTTLKAAEWGLKWPVDPPSSFPVDQLPSAIPTVVDIEDLPTK